MSDNLRKTFPRALFIPFNPGMQSKLELATDDPNIDTIVIDSNIKSPDTLSREAWIVGNILPPVLEIGCQDGHLFISQGYNMVNWYGIDIDIWNLPHFVQGDAHLPPFKSHMFSTVVFAEIGEHVDDPKLAVKKAINMAQERVIISLPNEHMWSVECLPFMELKDKEDLDHLTHRQEIDKNSRWLQGCLNPKELPANWDEEVYEHLWHKRHFYDPEEVTMIPSGRTRKPEIDLLQFMDEVTKEYDEEQGTKTNQNWHYEKLNAPPWAFHMVLIALNSQPIMTAYEFRKLVTGYDGWYGQVMGGEQGEAVAFMRRI